MTFREGRTLAREDFDRWDPASALTTQLILVREVLRSVETFPAKACSTVPVNRDALLFEAAVIRMIGAIEFFVHEKLREHRPGLKKRAYRVPQDPFEINDRFHELLGKPLFDSKAEHERFFGLQRFFLKRHCVVHSCGLVDKPLFDHYPRTLTSAPGEGCSVPFDSQEFLDALDSILELCKRAETAWPSKATAPGSFETESTGLQREIRAEVKRLEQGGRS